jgi:hypothetical protein
MELSVRRSMESSMDEQLGRGLDFVPRQGCVCGCLTKKILIRGLVSPRDHRLLF